MTSIEPVPFAARILVVDDTPANVELLVRMLARRGYAPQAASSGAEALAAAHNAPPDLILLDINMPGMDGFEVCQRLKSDPALRDIPVLFISAQHESSDKVRAFELGAVDYVTKPFQLAEVFARVETHLKLSQLQRELTGYNLHLEKMVLQRTQELETSYARVQELSRLQGEFLSMISHEMRTPAHGLLGVGDLLLLMCPPSEELSEYADMFNQSRDRLLWLFNDVELIAKVDRLVRDQAQPSPSAELLERLALPGVQVTLDCVDSLRAGTLCDSGALCDRALHITLQLALAFSSHKQALHLTGHSDGPHLFLRAELDALTLSDAQAQDFFAIGSSARSSSVAEHLALAPVVAHQILRAFGGGLKLVKGTGNTGYLEATLVRGAEPVPAAS